MKTTKIIHDSIEISDDLNRSIANKCKVLDDASVMTGSIISITIGFMYYTLEKEMGRECAVKWLTATLHSAGILLHKNGKNVPTISVGSKI